MRKIALLFLDTFLDANFNFLVFLGRPGRDPGHDPSWVMTQIFELGHDRNGSWPIWVMTRFGHDPIQNLGHDRDPFMTHNTNYV